MLPVLCCWILYFTTVPCLPVSVPQFSQRFQPYVQYCLQVKRTMAYAREQQDNNPLFNSFVQVGERAPGRAAGWTLDHLIIPISGSS